MKTTLRFVQILLVLFLCGCAARQVHDDKVGAPPVSEGGEWKCINNHYQYNHLTGRCERR
jgi:hypothetical protein